jgi:hypothetical protein
VNPSQKSRSDGYTAHRRTLLLGMLGGAGFGLVGSAGTALAASPNDPAADRAPDFNFDTGNAVSELFVEGRQAAGGLMAIAPMDITMMIRVTQMVQLSWFDAVAPYHSTAVGVYSRLGRRPSSESATNRNKNIALLYASHRVLVELLPTQTAEWRKIMTSVGLDPDDRTENKTTPVGIGNLAGKAIIANRRRDGMNQLGDEGGRRYNPQPYADYLQYQPVNSAFKIRDPSHWQPLLGPHDRRLKQGAGDVGAYVIQQFVTPQLSVTKPYSYTDPDEFRVAPPKNSDHTNTRAYKRQVDEVLAASAELTDEQKLMAEIFDDKFLGIGLSIGEACAAHDLDLDGWIQAHMLAATAAFDTCIAVWRNKLRYDAPRPFTAIRHVYGGKKVTAWGGPGKGTVSDIPADQWRGYLLVGDHPEYPSGSTSLMAAQAQVTRRFLDSDTVDFTLPYAKGSSLAEPGVTPAKDLVVHFDTWTDLNRACGTSRLWGGVHFMPAVEAGWELGARVGDRAYEFVVKHIKGEVDQ